MKILANPLFCLLGIYRTLCSYPCMTTKEIKIIKDLLISYNNNRINILEWGSGRSTVYFAKYLKKNGIKFNWYAIDNSREWYEEVLKKVKKNNLDRSIHLYLFDFKPFWQKEGWGWENPPSDGFAPEEESEKQYITFPESLRIRFDLIIIDGRFRRRCLIEAQKILSEGGKVILHDAQKKHYHSPLSLYKNGRFVDAGHLYVEGTRTRCAVWIGSNA